jgi:hypothetical protein
LKKLVGLTNIPLNYFNYLIKFNVNINTSWIKSFHNKRYAISSDADPGFFYGGGLKIVFFGTWDIIYNIAASD